MDSRSRVKTPILIFRMKRVNCVVLASCDDSKAFGYFFFEMLSISDQHGYELMEL